MGVNDLIKKILNIEIQNFQTERKFIMVLYGETAFFSFMISQTYDLNFEFCKYEIVANRQKNKIKKNIVG